MTTRDEDRVEIERSCKIHPEGTIFAMVRDHGIEKVIDYWQSIDAEFRLADIDLRRYPNREDIKLAVLRARAASREVNFLLRETVRP